MFSLNAYLDHLRLTDVPSGAAGLAALQEAQMRAIPFENIDPLLGRVPDLDGTAVFDKLIHRGRGGYCFELNGLLFQALTALGYTPTKLLARVRTPTTPDGGARSHLAMQVEAEGQSWLVDAGLGGHGALHPVEMTLDVVQSLPNGDFRLRDHAATGETLLERRSGTDWVTQYGFDVSPVRQIDIETANYITATWPKAPFPENLMAAFYRPAGRIAMFNRSITRGLPPNAETTTCTDRDALALLLTREFNLTLDADSIAAIWIKIAAAPTTR